MSPGLPVLDDVSEYARPPWLSVAPRADLALEPFGQAGPDSSLTPAAALRRPRGARVSPARLLPTASYEQPGPRRGSLVPLRSVANAPAVSADPGPTPGARLAPGPASPGKLARFATP